MAGASKEHNAITFNMVRHIGNQLDGSDCQGYSNDMRVRVQECNRYYYPDLVVVCGEPQFEDTSFDNLTNPTVIIEVLSESTQTKDRGEKLLYYRTLASVQVYVLVAQDAPRAECYTRQEGGWFYTVTEGLDAELILEAIGVRLRLADIYTRVTFPPQEESQDDERGERR
jgi:Uma2 family endonuclease